MCIQVCMHVFSQIVFYAWGSNLFPVGVGINFGAPKWPLPGRCPALPSGCPTGCPAVARLVARWLPGWLPGGCCWGLCWVKEMHVFLCVPLPLGSKKQEHSFKVFARSTAEAPWCFARSSPWCRSLATCRRCARNALVMLEETWRCRFREPST